MNFTGILLKKNNFRFFTIGWAVFIFILTTIPSLPQPDKPPEDIPGLRFDYLFHYLAFLVLGSLCVFWQTNKDIRIPIKKYLIVLLSGMLFTFLDEWHQVLIPGRSFNPVDFYLNAVGFLSGFLFTYHYFFRHLMVHRNRLPKLKQKLFGLSNQLLPPEK